MGKMMATAPKSSATFMTERAAIRAGQHPVAGVDEAGRGPWAGPVIAAAVILNPAAIPDGIADSKALTEAKRERIFSEIMRTAEVGIGMQTAADIDRINILQATIAAMRAALHQLPRRPSLALIDGNRPPGGDIPTRTIIQGDAICLSIAAASIIAKVTRDRLMTELGRTHPGYGFEQHKGYGTALHRECITRLGVMQEHRKSFKPIQTALTAQHADIKQK
jgi:ribonuclease HII